MRTVSIGMLLLALASACGEDDASKGAYLDHGEEPEDCEGELSCKVGRCTPPCSFSSEDPDAVCADVGGVCAVMRLCAAVR